MLRHALSNDKIRNYDMFSFYDYLVVWVDSGSFAEKK